MPLRNDVGWVDAGGGPEAGSVGRPAARAPLHHPKHTPSPVASPRSRSAATPPPAAAATSVVPATPIFNDDDAGATLTDLRASDRRRVARLIEELAKARAAGL